MSNNIDTRSVSTKGTSASLLEAITASSEDSRPKRNANTSKSKTGRKRRRRRKQLRIGDALRCEGLDEREVAQKLKDLIERQTPNTNDKLLAETLMNCFRYLDEAPRSGGKSGAKAPVRLVHVIPRPQRLLRTKNQELKGTQE
ncbi:MAG TPA: hypothetical protein VIY69_13540 [Candidatus Acidoferrales bacterium]